MATQGPDEVGFDWLTASRARVLRELADDRTEREAAERLGLSYHGVRSIVEDLKAQTGEHDVRALRRWWRANRQGWLVWWADQAGVSPEGYAR